MQSAVYCTKLSALSGGRAVARIALDSLTERERGLVERRLGLERSVPTPSRADGLPTDAEQRYFERALDKLSRPTRWVVLQEVATD